MLALDDVRAHVIERCPARAPGRVPLAEALGLVTGKDVTATESIPPFANTAMDGFALRAADTVGAPVDLEIVETIAAGHAPTRTLARGQASRIMTGAVIPEGADAIVMVERTSVDGDRVMVEIEVPVGNHVRPAGDDITAGELVIPRGTVLGASHLGVLASLGVNEVVVHPRPRVGVISTGDELVADGGPLAPGQIRDSNRRTLLSLLAQCDAMPVDLGLVPDDEDLIEAAVLDGVSQCDALVTSGGVSMGDYDYVKAVLDRIGEMRWMQVAIKPAKPFAFGTIGDVPVFGLPGNPVSSMVSFELFARTGLRSMMGYPSPVRPTVTATAGEDLRRTPDGKTHFLRVLATHDDDGLVVRSTGGQGSHMLWAMAKANALAVVPDGDGYRAGERLDVVLLEAIVDR